MAHSLTTPPATATPISTRSKKKTHFSLLGFQRMCASHHKSNEVLQDKLIHRRTITLGLASAVLGLNVGERNASAARRPPPTPPSEEKKDPNVSGVTAKVLASKKRKEAMKESMAKLREKGKPINEPSK